MDWETTAKSPFPNLNRFPCIPNFTSISVQGYILCKILFLFTVYKILFFLVGGGGYSGGRWHPGGILAKSWKRPGCCRGHVGFWRLTSDDVRHPSDHRWHTGSWGRPGGVWGSHRGCLRPSWSLPRTRGGLLGRAGRTGQL